MSDSVMRRPRFRLLVNGTPVLGAETAEVSSNGYFQSDRFRAKLALGLDGQFTAAWWANQSTVGIEIQIGLLAPGAAEGSASWQSMFVGNTDSIQIDPVAACIDIDGRDLSSLLIDAKTQETFVNQTSSQIAATLAARHGMTADVQATTTPVGQYYELEHDRLTLDNFHRQTTEWDLLTYLADHEGFDVWVTGHTLHFQPAPGPNTPPFPITFTPGPVPALNVETLMMERSLTLAKDIQVTVKSWNSRRRYPVVRSVKGTAGTSNGKEPAQTYVFVKPNMTPDEALKFAQQKLTELTKHERKLHITMPGELTLTPRSMIALAGTGTAFDQSYFVAEVEREISFTGGFTQRVLAKNTSPRTQAVVE